MTSKRPGAGLRTPKREVYTLEKLDQIRVLADPLRIRILEAFCAERTTKQVAELLGEKPTKLYHHVEALQKVGLITLSRTRPNRGTTEKYYLAVARAFRTDSRALQPRGRRGGGKKTALRGMTTTIFETTAAELVALLDRGEGGENAIEQEAVVSFLEVHATAGEVEEIRGRLQALLRSLVEAGESAVEPGARERYRLTLAFYPLDGTAKKRRRSG